MVYGKRIRPKVFKKEHLFDRTQELNISHSVTIISLKLGVCIGMKEQEPRVKNDLHRHVLPTALTLWSPSFFSNEKTSIQKLIKMDTKKMCFFPTSITSLYISLKIIQIKQKGKRKAIKSDEWVSGSYFGGSVLMPYFSFRSFSCSSFFFVSIF